jgi:predicted  nucleic acid-binding Zn-ribbon protein
MSSKRPYDPYDSIKNISQLWEKQINDFIFLMTNNNEYIKISKVRTDAHTRYLESLRKNQEIIGTILNLPTKTDMANVANLTIQTENKIDALEEQIWELQDSVKNTNKEIESVIEVSKEIIKLTKQLKTELVKSKKELSETKSLQSDIQELKQEMLKLSSVKEEVQIIKGLVEKDKAVEPMLVGAGPTK